MKKIVLTNKEYTKIAQLIGKELNRPEFLNWLHSLAPKDYFPNPQTTEERNEYFFGSGQEIKVKNLPTLTFEEIQSNNKDITYHQFILKDHGSYRNAIKIFLKEEFGIDYYQEMLDILDSRNKVNLEASNQIINHIEKDFDFAQKNTEKIKKLITKNLGKDNKVRNTMVINFINHALDNVNMYGNDWTVNLLNETLSLLEETVRSKHISFLLNQISKKLHVLDVEEVKPNVYLKKLLKGHSSIICEEPMSFFWQMDFALFSHEFKVNMNFISQNMGEIMSVVEDILKQEETLNCNIFKAKNKQTVAILHESPELNQRLKKIFEHIPEVIKQNTILDKSMVEKAFLYLNLNESLSQHDYTSKKLKI